MPVNSIPDYKVAFVRNVGSYLNTSVALAKLGQWAANNKLTPQEQYFIGISLDDLEVVDEFACRYDSCVTLPSGFDKQPHSEVEFKLLSGGTYAAFSFYDTIDNFVLAYQNVFELWLPNSKYDL